MVNWKGQAILYHIHQLISSIKAVISLLEPFFEKADLKWLQLSSLVVCYFHSQTFWIRAVPSTFGKITKISDPKKSKGKKIPWFIDRYIPEQKTTSFGDFTHESLPCFFSNKYFSNKYLYYCLDIFDTVFLSFNCFPHLSRVRSCFSQKINNTHMSEIVLVELSFVRSIVLFSQSINMSFLDSFMMVSSPFCWSFIFSTNKAKTVITRFFMLNR